ncbi:hypothetical protein H4K35_09030 [Myroides sp. NP-2]|uniref:hypothetical protein n=1 Tax=Myroides sp. NP-2 TaxID=2759945 RepID=UPI0015F9963A|nr:hypothetical protein [Myroides sp. NP-2]MBB1150270.1 hypothetical protein [Myroides sp. NP-2]
MANLEFKPYLLTEEKPKEFEDFRNLTSELLKDIEGDITFYHIATLGKFEITSNNLKLDQNKLNSFINEISDYLI